MAGQIVLQKGSLPYNTGALSNGLAVESKMVRLERIWVYPIKSCGGFCPQAWPLGTRGLLWDREWALVDASGVALTQKRCPRLATVSTTIDLVSRGPHDLSHVLHVICSFAHSSTPVNAAPAMDSS